MTFSISVFGPLAGAFDSVNGSFVANFEIKIVSDDPDGEIFTFFDTNESAFNSFGSILKRKSRHLPFVSVCQAMITYRKFESVVFELEKDGLEAPIEYLIFQKNPRSLQFLSARRCETVPVPEEFPSVLKRLIFA